MTRSERKPNRYIYNFKEKNMIRTQPHESVDLNITYRCNLKCNNCDRCCYIEHPYPDITLERVREFCGQLPEKILSVVVVGGEPTLHPRLHEILDILIATGKQIVVYTNGLIPFLHGTVERYGQKTPRREQDIFFSHQVAPVDINGELYWTKPCYVSDYCGWGYDFEGWFPCGCGAMISKIFDLNVSVATFEQMTPEAIKKQRNAICRYCGYYLKRDANSGPDSHGKQITSPSWEKALKKYIERIKTTPSKEQPLC